MFGLAVGGVFGALFGLIDTIGIDKEFQRQVRDMVKPGTSALFMAVDKLTTDKAIEALSKYGATGPQVLAVGGRRPPDPGGAPRRRHRDRPSAGDDRGDRLVAAECRAATPQLSTDTELDRLCVDTIRMGNPGRHRHRRMRPRPLRRPSCTLQPGATGRGTANPAGASGLMQTGIGGAAGDACDPLRKYLPNPDLGPHDPTTAVQLGALVLIKDKGAPTGQPINTYFPYARAYNGTGRAADAYAARVIADTDSYQGSGRPPSSDSAFWTQALLLNGELSKADPKRLRHRRFHVAARLAFSARQGKLHLPGSWPWTDALKAALEKLKALPAATG